MSWNEEEENQMDLSREKKRISLITGMEMINDGIYAFIKEIQGK